MHKQTYTTTHTPPWTNATTPTTTKSNNSQHQQWQTHSSNNTYHLSIAVESRQVQRCPTAAIHVVDVSPAVAQRLHQGHMTFQTCPAQSRQSLLVRALQLCPFAQLLQHMVITVWHSHYRNYGNLEHHQANLISIQPKLSNCSRDAGHNTMTLSR